MQNKIKDYILNIIQEIGLSVNYNILIKKDVYNIIFEKNISKKHLDYIRNKLNKFMNGSKFNLLTTSNNDQKQKISKIQLPNVKRMLMIASCKGGVGKSTLTLILAHMLNNAGYKIGVVDADIYGPSIPILFDTQGKVEISQNKFIPKESNKIKTISMGNIVDPEKAAVWRGPMVSKTLYQLMTGTNWQEIDLLLIDTPPGTGDVALSLMEKYDINGSILITTPHLLSKTELVKSIDMFNKLNIPILGIIENMSYFIDQNKNKQFIFGESLLNDIIKKIPLLGNIPIEKDIKIWKSNVNMFNININKIIDILFDEKEALPNKN